MRRSRPLFLTLAVLAFLVLVPSLGPCRGPRRSRRSKLRSGTAASPARSPAGYSSKIWTGYNGTPRCCKATRWSRSHLVARRGVMTLENYRDSGFGGQWVSAGISMGRSLNQTYGKWTVRFRMDRAVGIGMCMGLWPKKGWPPEIDFAEESSQYGARGVETATLHYGAHNSQIRRKVTGDFSKWHVIGVAVDAAPARLPAWTASAGARSPASRSHQPMHLFIQTHVGSNGKGGGMPAALVHRRRPAPRLGARVPAQPLARGRSAHREIRLRRFERKQHSLALQPTAYPVSAPSLAITRWHGTITLTGFCPTVRPTARARVRSPSWPASAP